MSNTAGFGWTVIDLEAERQRARRRELLAELAGETAAADAARERHRALHLAHRVGKPTAMIPVVVEDDTVEGLEGLLDETRRARIQAEAGLRAATAQVLGVERRQAGRPGGARAKVRRPAEDASRSARAPEQREPERPAILESVLTALERDAESCRAEDLSEMRRKLDLLREAPNAPRADLLRTDIESLIHRSVTASRVATAGEADRIRLLKMLEEALPEDRRRLGIVVASASEPGAFEAEVQESVRRADRGRERAKVAAAVLDALREQRYAVSDNLVDALDTDGKVVVPYAGGPGEGPGHGYGVRLTFQAADGGPELVSTLVRRAGADVGMDADTEAQRRFCDHSLPAVEVAAGRHGAQLQRRWAMQPGLRPTVVVGEADWPAAIEPRRNETSRTKKKAPKYKPAERPRER